MAFCLHGAVENGRIFYSPKNPDRGFAPFLARLGFHVYVPDLGGRGHSTPTISRGSHYSQNSAITREIPALLRLVRGRHPSGTPELWVSHSWGGVLLHSALARYPELRAPVQAEVFFATKRSVRVWNLERLLLISCGWNFLGPILVQRHGYLPTRERGWGSDNETAESLRESIAWVRPGPWVDPTDGFDYGKALAEWDRKPPLLSIAGSRDRALGHPRDVQDFVAESHWPPESHAFWTIGRRTGFSRNYGHNDMLSDRACEKDHFPKIAEWLCAQGAFALRA